MKPGGAAAGEVAASNASTSTTSSSGLTGAITGSTGYASYDPDTHQVLVSDGRSYILDRMNGDADIDPGGGIAPLYLGPITGF